MPESKAENGTNCGHPNHGGRDHDCTGFLPCDDPACPCGSKSEMDRSLTDAVLGISRMIDSTYPRDLDAEAHMWRRCMKVVEECGEAAGAILGLLGENPRKGRTHTPEQVRGELLDVAVAALGAVAFLTGNGAGGDPVRLFEEHALRVRERLADTLNPHPDRATPPAVTASCGCVVGGLHRHACASVGHVDPPSTTPGSRAGA